MNQRRGERLAVLIKKEVSALLLRQGEQEPGKMMTVTKVELTPDKKKALVFLTVFPETEEKNIFRAIKKEEKYFGRLLKHTINIKVLPDISFVLDRGEKARVKLDIIFEKISEGKNKRVRKMAP